MHAQVQHKICYQRPPMAMCRPAATLMGYPLAVLGCMWTLPAIYIYTCVRVCEHQRLYMGVTGYQYPALL